MDCLQFWQHGRVKHRANYDYDFQQDDKQAVKIKIHTQPVCYLSGLGELRMPGLRWNPQSGLKGGHAEIFSSLNDRGLLRR